MRASTEFEEMKKYLLMSCMLLPCDLFLCQFLSTDALKMFGKLANALLSDSLA